MKAAFFVAVGPLGQWLSDLTNAQKAFAAAIALVAIGFVAGGWVGNFTEVPARLTAIEVEDLPDRMTAVEESVDQLVDSVAEMKEVQADAQTEREVMLCLLQRMICRQDGVFESPRQCDLRFQVRRGQCTTQP